MKEGIKDVVTDVFALVLWGVATYKFFFTEEGLNAWVFGGLILAGILLLGLSIKQLSSWGKKILNIVVKKKLGDEDCN